jgi:hypothetical protein
VYLYKNVLDFFAFGSINSLYSKSNCSSRQLRADNVKFFLALLYLDYLACFRVSWGFYIDQVFALK